EGVPGAVRSTRGRGAGHGAQVDDGSRDRCLGTARDRGAGHGPSRRPPDADDQLRVPRSGVRPRRRGEQAPERASQARSEVLVRLRRPQRLSGPRACVIAGPLARHPWKLPVVAGVVLAFAYYPLGLVVPNLLALIPLLVWIDANLERGWRTWRNAGFAFGLTVDLLILNWML